MTDDFGELDGIDPADAELARGLVEGRPLPAPGFRGDLRRRLATLKLGPRHLRRLVLAYSAAGFVLLGIAALGTLDAGPLAPASPAHGTHSASVGR